MNSNPIVSVIVPTYNRPILLRRALESIVKQTFRNFEVIIVNDGGPDVNDVVLEFKEKFSIYLETQEIRQGAGAARNIGLRRSHGKYVAYLDDDDIYYPEHLDVLYQCLERENGVFAYSDAYRVWSRFEGSECIQFERDRPYSINFSRFEILRHNITPTLCIMHTRKILDSTGIFDETLKSHEDWDLWIRISRWCELQHIPQTTCEFSWWPEGGSVTNDPQSKIDFKQGAGIVLKRYQGFRELEEIYRSRAYRLGTYIDRWLCRFEWLLFRKG